MAVEELTNKPHLGYRLTAALTPDEALHYTPGSDKELVAIERNIPANPELYREYCSLLGSGIEVMDLAKFAEKKSGKIPIEAIDESWFIEYCGHTESR